MDNDAEHDGLEFVTALYDVIQPTGLPVLPMFDVDGRFCLPDDATEPGGLWFDVVVLPDDRVALVVGEAPGIGMATAVAAAQMRGVIRAGLRRDGDAVDALQLADIHAEDVADARGTTAAIVLLDPVLRLATYASAGHPPPWLLPAGGPAVLLSDTGGGPLGTGAGTGYARATCSLSEGDAVLLASAAAHRSEAVAFPGAAAEAGADPAFAGLHRTAGELASHLASDDALCLVAARLRTPAHRALVVRLEGEADPARCAREELGTWLTELRASPMDQMGLTHAASELVTNAVQHGARSDDRVVELRARLESNGVVLIEVLDHGTWQAPSDDCERGRGLAMAAGLVDHLGVAIRPSGTRAFVQHRLSRPVPIETVAPAARTAHVNAGVEVVHTAPYAVSLRGAFAHQDVERVAAEILVASRGGTVRLSLDVTEVTSLSTSAVRLLADLTSVNHAVGLYAADIEITSAADSTTQRTLDINRVPHHVA